MDIGFLKTSLEMGIRTDNNDELRSDFILHQKGGSPIKVALDLDLPLSTIKIWQDDQKVLAAGTGAISKY
jgi:hypothetical protein